MSDDGLHFDVLDGETGHVIASRTLSENQDMQFANYKFTMKGDAQKNDRFYSGADYRRSRRCK